MSESPIFPRRTYTQYLVPAIVALSLIYQTYFVPFDASRPSAAKDSHKLPIIYQNLLVIGASYNDNAHERKLEHALSLRDYYPYNLYGGRYSNGPVAVEYLAESEAQMINYAYGHSTIDNELTPSAFPATKDQIAQYLSDLEDSTVQLKPGKSLYYFNSGINSVTRIWLNLLADSTELSEAQPIITKNVDTLIGQIRSLAQPSSDDFDLFIAGIPPLDTVPLHLGLGENDAEKMEILRILAAQFNGELEAAARVLKEELKGERQVFYFDMAALWKDMYESPGKHGLSPDLIFKSCWVTGATEICSDPENYIYFDASHPTSVTNKRMARKMAEVIRAGLAV